VNAFFDKYKAIAIEEYLSNGILPSITLAQAAIESNYGKSTLAKNANNFFGIKCGSSWKGEKVLANDDAPNECFRKYSNVAESFKDHSKFLRNNKRYSNLFNDTDFNNWADELQADGYATAQTYASSLKSVINSNNLQAVDELAFKKKEITKSLQ
jgi:flagellum-specific peptidoglycan hydrolase FlgJ